ncbi:sulfurtransferase [Pseudonocardia sp.]|uniref:sulfurtransferase n=1 Tax=Pseudonocardia sp. TaxID=60912 RepID=UPI0026123755|nr:sulfurtransferase [Pseudonocardia sp.]
MSPLISPADLAALLAGRPGPDIPVVLDVAGALPGARTRADHHAGHVPGAAPLGLDEDLASRPGALGRHPLPEADRLQAALRRAGVRPGAPVVAYDRGNGSVAARAWWLLRWAGHPADRVAVLDGGWEAWVGAGLPATAEPSAPVPGDIEVRPGGMPVLDADAAAGVVEAGGVLMDARVGPRFRGETEPLDPVAGHIPGAVNAPAADLVGPDGRWLSAAALAERLGALGIRGGEAVGAYCGSGVNAAALVLAAEFAGVRTPAEPVPLYVGSWSNWCADPARPVATGPADPDRLRSRP